MSEFEGRRVVVTGGSSGVGRACVELLLGQGARVANLDLDPSPEGVLSPTTERITDVRDTDSVNQAVLEIAAELGGIDVVVNNAAISYVGGVEDGEESEWLRLYDTNVLGYVRVIRAALPFLRQSNSATIVNLSSTTATSGFRRRAAYASTKGAIESMTRAMAADLVVESIVVNAVSPGTVDTPLMAKLASRAADPAAARAAYDARQPTGRMVSSEEVARAVAYCAHPSNRSTVGSTLVVDGGILGLHLTEA